MADRFRSTPTLPTVTSGINPVRLRSVTTEQNGHTGTGIAPDSPGAQRPKRASPPKPGQTRQQVASLAVMFKRESWREVDFWRQVQVTHSEDGAEHWLWTGPLDRAGYGRVCRSIGGVVYQERAHRLAWELVRGPIPAGMTLDHRNPPCGIYRCVNVRDCLEPVTDEENSRRAWHARLNRLLSSLVPGPHLLSCLDAEACYVARAKGLVTISEVGMVALTAEGVGRLPKALVAQVGRSPVGGDV